MLVDVQAFVFDAGRNTQAMQFLNSIEENKATSGCPEVDDKDAEAFCTEEAPAMTVESTIGRGEQARQQCAENAANTMNGGCAYRVVDVQSVVDELDGKDEHRSADEADDDSTYRRDDVATGGDAHKTCQNTVQSQRERGLLVLQPCDEHRRHSASRSSKIGCQEHMRDGDAVHLARGSELRTWVKAKPAHPKDEDS